jgi:hypothetical protein
VAWNKVYNKEKENTMTMVEAAKILGVSRQRIYQKLVTGIKTDFIKGELKYRTYQSRDGKVEGTCQDHKWIITYANKVKNA